MPLDEILTLIRQSDPGYWKQLASGTTYRGLFATSYSPGAGTSLAYREHEMAYVYRPDARLTLCFGLEPREDQELDFGFNHEFADESVSECLVDFFFCGSLVHREAMVYVDGARALLPACHQRYSGEVDSDGEKLVEYFATQESVDIARVVHDLTHTESFDDALKQAGIVVRG